MQIENTILTSSNLYTGERNKKGELCDVYSPFLNLTDRDTLALTSFTTKELKFDLEHPVDILVQDAADGAVNLIINDDKNVPKLVNSRFSVLEEGTFNIPDRTGFKDTTIYDDTSLDIDTSLKAIPKNIPSVEFLGLLDNAGRMPCGMYSFYFKLADADGNESEVVAESGVVCCHVGTTNSPNAIRMGMEEENSGKAILFKLTGIDLGFDFVRVYYAKSSSGNDQYPATVYYAVMHDYPIDAGTCMVNITGSEILAGVSAKELFTDYADIAAAKTLTIHNNVLLMGNTKELEHDWAAIKEFTWKIIATEVLDRPGCVGSLNHDHEDVIYKDPDITGCYYNAKNIYYRVGYWPGEIYRFGIVYIFNDNSLSPVIDLQGVDFNLLKNNKLRFEDLLESTPFGYTSWKAETDDCYFNKSIRSNSRGVYRFTSGTHRVYDILGGIMKPKPLSIKFDFSKIHYTNDERPLIGKWLDVFEKHRIKGCFIVRQKRIPNIIAQGIIIGLSKKDFGSLPVLVLGSQCQIYPFLDSRRMISENAELSKVAAKKDNILYTAMLVPDAELHEPVFNDLFVSNRYYLKPSVLLTPLYLEDKHTQIMISSRRNMTKEAVAALTNVPDSTSSITDGSNFFSSTAGSAADPIKMVNLLHAWNKTMPLVLTTNRNYVRGNFGPYVGLNENPKIPYGSICDIYQEGWANSETALDIAFNKNMLSGELYHAVCDRQVVSLAIQCYRGDCFISMFTHRMHRNFIDSEYPTNHSVIDPACWGKNFAVRATAYNLVSNDGTMNASFNNCAKENEGWYLEGTLNLNTPNPIYNLIADTFEINTAKYVNGKIKLNDDDPYIIDADDYRFDWDKLLGKYVPCFTSDTKGKWKACTSPTQRPTFPKDVLIGARPKSGVWHQHIYLKHPEPAKTGMALVDSIVTLTDASINEYTARGKANINRADLNAVAIGQWISFPVCSNTNLAMRDIDRSNASEEAIFNKKRGFFPLESKASEIPLRDSNVINGAAKISVPHKFYGRLPDHPYFKQEFFNRIYNSKIDDFSTYANSFKLVLETAYKDYAKEFGTITKIESVGNAVYIIFTHGIGKMTLGLSANRTTIEQSEMAILSDTYGSMWKDSIILTPHGLYGVDTVAKVIWAIVGDSLLIISDKRINKFLIDNIDLSEFVFRPYIGHINVKSHYNANKHDVIFTYYNDIPYHIDTEESDVLDIYTIDDFGRVVEKATGRVTSLQAHNLKIDFSVRDLEWQDYSDLDINYWKPGVQWSVCWNEELQVFLTFYDWIPLESVNIDNIFFSFDKEAVFNADKSSTVTKLLFKDKDWRELPSAPYNKRQLDTAFNEYCQLQALNPDLTGYWIPVRKGNLFGVYLTALSPHWELLCSYSGKTRVISVAEGTNFYVIDGTCPNDYTVTLRAKNEEAGLIRVYDAKELKAFLDGELSWLIIHPSQFGVDNYKYRSSSFPMYLWKHGLAGIYDNQGEIKPTNWYGKQHEFNFEFVVLDETPMLKIFNNLKIISNKTPPKKFEYEIVGEGYAWWEYKPLVHWINSLPVPSWSTDEDFWWKYVLTMPNNDKPQLITVTNGSESLTVFGYPGFRSKIVKLPYLKIETVDRKGRKDKSYNIEDNWSALIPTSTKDYKFSYNTSETVLKYDPDLNEYRVHDESLGNDILEYGRTRGNMLYLEDFWNIEIRPLAFNWCYMQNGEMLKKAISETRHRDKYIKIKVRYSGEDLAVISSIITLFDVSYA